ncbi:MlaD family protein [Pannonibacter sp. Pt2-lr]
MLFNGIKVGDVSALDFDPADPRIVIATIRVSPNAPLRKDVRATLGFQGLTGVAYVDLKGVDGDRVASGCAERWQGAGDLCRPLVL